MEIQKVNVLFERVRQLAFGSQRFNEFGSRDLQSILVPGSDYFFELDRR